MVHRHFRVGLVFFVVASACTAHRVIAPPVDAEAQAASRTRGARSGRYELSITANDATRTLRLGARGAFDRGVGRYEAVIDLSSAVPDVGTATLIADGELLYVDCPYLARAFNAPTRWIRVRGSPVDLFGFGADPFALLDQPGVRLALDDAGFVRTATVRFDAGPFGYAVAVVEFAALGDAVTIEVPAQHEVTDETEALAAATKLATGG